MLRAIVAAFVVLAIAPAADAKKHRMKILIEHNCAADVRQVCASLPRGHNKMSCLLSHAHELSGGCTDAMHEIACNPNAPLKVKQTFPCEK